MKKYKLTEETIEKYGKTLYRIEAVRDFWDVKAGEKGGYIQSEDNLSQDGDCWIYGNAEVFGDAKVYGNARVYGDARVYGGAWVYDNAWVSGDARVYGDAWVYDNAQVYGDAQVYGNAEVFGDAEVYGDAEIGSDADYICLQGFGPQNRHTTMFRCKDGTVFVVCGCFEGTLDEFAAWAKQTHGDNKYGKEYGLCIQLAKLHFEIT